MTAASRWLLLWCALVTLGFVWLQLAAADGARGPLQYLSYLGHLVSGELGIAALEGRSVMAIVIAGLPVDLLLTGGVLLAAWSTGAAWGLLAAARADDALGIWLMRVARGFVSVSVVALVPLCLLLASAPQRWAMATSSAALWLPMLALAVPYAAHLARATQRGALLALASEPVFMARAMGLSQRRIWARQVVPAVWRFSMAMPLPLVSIFTAVIVIENLLGTVGTGPFFVTAARQQDHAVTVGLCIVYCTLFIAAHLAVDVLRAWHSSSRAVDVEPMRELA